MPGEHLYDVNRKTNSLTQPEHRERPRETMHKVARIWRRISFSPTTYLKT